MRVKKNYGFSLIEVVIAIGLVAGGIVVILALLSNIAREPSNSKDLQVALRFTDALQVQLETEMTSVGLESMAQSIPQMTTNAEVGKRYVVERTGVNLRELKGSEAPQRDQYFLIVVRRFTAGDLVFATGDAYLALDISVFWPYRVQTPEALLSATDLDARQSVSFNLVLSQ